MHSTCNSCSACLEGDWNYCSGPKSLYGFGNTDQGSFAHGAVWKKDALFRIPDGIESEAAAPLMCAGITVWAPLSVGGVKATDVVGV